MRLREDFAMPAMDSIHRGTLTYERGLELVDIQGWMQLECHMGTGFVVVFGDPDHPAWQQRHTVVPISRVVEFDIEEVSPLESGTVPRQREALDR